MCRGFLWITPLHNWHPLLGPLSSRGENYELRCSLVICRAFNFNMELLAIDFLSLEKGKGGFENILVVTDSFTEFSWAFPTRDQKATTVTKLLWEKIFINYGMPQWLHSDQGRDFEGKVIKSLCQFAGIRKSRTTPYHPQGNGQAERFTRFTLDQDNKSRWPEYLSPLVYAHNCTKHSTNGFSPFLLMFGREPQLPIIDVALGVNSVTSGSGSYPAYIANLRDRPSLAYQKVIEESRKSTARNKQSYDSRAHQATIQVGDLVLVRNLSIRGKHKLLIAGRRILTEWWNVSLDFQFTRSKKRMVRNVFSTTTFCYRSKVHLLHQLLVLNLSDLNGHCSSKAPQKIPVATSKSS